MKEYLLLLRGGKPMTSKTEAENEAEMQAWGVYMGSLAQNGSMVGGPPISFRRHGSICFWHCC
ncbi:MAG: hypothetical protein JWR05_3079 [Mucilaginibacter sp.]|nr:hypothetical protein [Mucilaginibacter sp.]